MSTITVRRAAVFEAAAGVGKQYDRAWYAQRIRGKAATPGLPRSY